MRMLTRALAAATSAGLTLGVVVTLGASAASAATPAQRGIAALMATYSTSNGKFDQSTTATPNYGWWTSAVAMSTLLTYQQATGDTTYNADIATTFNKNEGSSFTNSYLDDTGWWGLVWMQAYDVTGVSQYLSMAEHDAQYIHGYWDATCGGGVWWSTDETYKNAIPNELFLQLTAGLHNRVPGDTTYLSWATAEWSWFSGSGLINSSHLVNDGLTAACVNNGQATWTYNQGVILSGLSELYEATGNAALLTTAEQIATAATTSHSLVSNGVLVDECGNNCSGGTGDAISFKGPFMRGLKTLAVTANTTTYSSFIAAQQNAIVSDDMGSDGQMGVYWPGPLGTPNSQSDAIGEDALVAALNPVAATTTAAPTATAHPTGAAPTTTPHPTISATPTVTGTAAPGTSVSSPVVALAGPVTLAGRRVITVRAGRAVVIIGKAAPGTSVAIFFRRVGATGYTQRRSLTADQRGDFVTSFAPMADFQYYAAAGTDVSAVITQWCTPTLTATPATGSGRAQVVLRGRAAPGSLVTLHFHRQGTSAHDYSLVRRIRADRAGRWVRRVRLTESLRVYASRGGLRPYSGTVLLRLS